MDLTTTVTRNVEIPPTLPDMDTLTDLTGNIVLKEVRPEADGLRVEGDLLWRGYFEEGGSDCLWEGAEFFSEHLDQTEYPETDSAILKPSIVGLRGEALSESTFRMEFDIKWEEEAIEPPSEPESIRKTDPEAMAAADDHVKTEIPKQPDDPHYTVEKTPKPKKTATTIDFERIQKKQTEQEATTVESDTTNGCPCPQFCLRYYRVEEADNLELIAQRFSASVAKLKECNRLDFEEVTPGKMIRIP